ncbi:MAG: IS1380 family transposase [Desulfobacteraceae bacterium]|nr:IS1380 family transposase [Pseudomonadota bacterium]MBU4462657.1 IS1380 family transposase [Pseudomonadota bacterium]MCG2755398.1 IS1380 family transposase [Desulfobacteraceae bacterium]
MQKNKMTKQTDLPLKFKKAEEAQASSAGLALLGEFCIGLGVLDWVDAYMPKSGKGARFKASEYLFPLVLMLNGGGRSLEDIRIIRSDFMLRDILPLKRVPSPDAIGDWLRRTADSGRLSGLEKTNRKLLKRALEYDDIKNYTLNIDTAVIEAEKESAKPTYKGFKGYTPIIGHLAENGLIVSEEFREGNVDPALKNLEFCRHCIDRMPAGKSIRLLRACPPSCQVDIIDFCNKKGVEFAIGGNLDEAMLRAIGFIPESDWKPHREGYIAETAFSFIGTKKTFRTIVLQKRYQKKLFNKEDVKSKYSAIATNIKGSAKDVFKWYNQECASSNNRINDLKVCFGMERMPCGQTGANAVFFRIGALSYNINRLFSLKTSGKSVTHSSN